jgi:hypothetical protein
MGCGRNGNDDVSESRDRHDTGCVCEVVRAIKDIQDNAEENCECPSNCFLEPLGSLVSPATRQNADTRVFVLKTADGSPFHAFFKSVDCVGCVSIFFRVEDIFDNCCATLRVLRPIEKNGTTLSTLNMVKNCCIDLSTFCHLAGFEATNDCITVDLNCFCAIQCIADVDLDICD